MAAIFDHDAALYGAELYAPRPLTDGERWTAEALSELRRGRYSVAAWLRFLRSSLVRADQSRRARPLLARQAGAWGLSGAAAWLAACRATRDANEVELSALGGLLWWLVVWQMLDWHLGMAEGGDGRPRARLSPADAVSLARYWLVPVAHGTRRSRTGLPIVIVLAGLTDWVDGALARRHGRTRLGRDLDTTADLAFLATAAISARASGRITRLGFWSLGARYAIGLAVSLGAVFTRARRPAIRARPWGAFPRVAGLAVCASGHQRTGTAVLLIGALVPPRSTAPGLSPA